MYLDLFQIVQRIVREGHIIDDDSLVAILVYAKQCANGASKAGRIKQSFMRMLMRKHDFRVFICKYRFHTLLFPRIYSLIIPVRKRIKKLCSKMHLVYYQVYVKFWIACWRIRQIMAGFLDVAQASANDNTVVICYTARTSRIMF